MINYKKAHDQEVQYIYLLIYLIQVLNRYKLVDFINTSNNQHTTIEQLMQFHNLGSSFNLYKGQQKQQNSISEKQKAQHLLSQSSNNHIHLQQNLSSQQFQQSQMQQEEQQYQCLTCNQRYNGFMRCRHVGNQNLENIQPQITEEQGKVYLCTYTPCSKAFNLQSGLIRHRVVHTGERPYQCDYENCAQSFNQKSNLNRHKKIHKNQKPFICEKCCKSFTTTTNLKQHSQTHLQKKQQRKQFICEIQGCNKKYLYSCNLKKHIQQHDDPLASCLLSQTEKVSEVKKAKFQISLSQCTISLAIHDPNISDHSQMKITYDSRLCPNAEIYNPVFILPNDEQQRHQKQQKQQKEMQRAQKRQDKSQKSQKPYKLHFQEQSQKQTVQQLLMRNLDDFFFNKDVQISASFYIHPDLMEYSLTVISQVVGLLKDKGTKQIRFFVQTKRNFKQCMQNLVNMYFQ